MNQIVDDTNALQKLELVKHFLQLFLLKRVVLDLSRVENVNYPIL